MKKTIMILILSFSLLATAYGASLETNKNHIFAGEDIEFTFTESAPISQRTIVFELEEETKEINLPDMEEGVFTIDFELTAPDTPGEYSVVSSELVKDITVEKSPLELVDVYLDPETIGSRETTKLSYTIKNTGDVMVYDIDAQILVLGASQNFEFDEEKQRLFDSLDPGEEFTEVEEIIARENAEGTPEVGVTITYIYDNEEHELSAYKTLTVGSFPWLEVIIIVVIILIAGRFILGKYIG